MASLRNSLKKIDYDDEVVIPSGVAKAPINLEDDKIVIKAGISPYSYMIFALETIGKNNFIVYEDILLMLYLYELGLFKYTINILGGRYTLRDLLNNEYVARDYSNKSNDLYKLTKKGLSIVNEVNEILSDKNRFISDNRQADLDLESDVSKTLEDYFK